MGSRCGDLDPAIVLYLIEHKQLGHEEINELLNEKSGLLGVADIGSSDLRDILAAKASGNHQAGIAVKTFTYRIKKYIGAYIAVMGGVDAVVFTAGIGENSPLIRELVCDGLQRFNGLEIILDPEKNTYPTGRLFRNASFPLRPGESRLHKTRYRPIWSLPARCVESTIPSTANRRRYRAVNSSMRECGC